jgi:hypothetical protein
MPIHAALINLLVLGFAAAAGVGLGRHRGKPARIALAMGVAFLGLGFLVTYRPDLWSHSLPWQDLMFVSNLFPAAFALLLPPLVFRQPARSGRLRLGILSCVLVFASLRGSLEFYLAPARSRITWFDPEGICRQSSRETCSAAALATLLRQHGIESTEKEITEFAWTRRNQGTSILGLYRALVFKSDQRTDLRPRICRMPVDALMAAGRPAVITVGLPRFGAEREAIEFGKAFEW